MILIEINIRDTTCTFINLASDIATQVKIDGPERARQPVITDPLRARYNGPVTGP